MKTIESPRYVSANSHRMASTMRRLQAIMLLGYLTLSTGGALANSMRGPLRWVALTLAYSGLLAQAVAARRALRLRRSV
jgi:hypothetical protein